MLRYLNTAKYVVAAMGGLITTAVNLIMAKNEWNKEEATAKEEEVNE